MIKIKGKASLELSNLVVDFLSLTSFEKPKNGAYHKENVLLKYGNAIYIFIDY